MLETLGYFLVGALSMVAVFLLAALTISFVDKVLSNFWEDILLLTAFALTLTISVASIYYLGVLIVDLYQEYKKFN